MDIRVAALSLPLAVLTAGCLPEDPPPPPAPMDACPETSGAGTMHSGVIDSDETWAAADGPHFVSSALDVRATLTIEPCVVVRVAESTMIAVGDVATSGRIVAHGTFTDGVARPIRFESAVDGAFWGGFFVEPTGALDFSRVALDHAGAASASGAAIEARGPDDGTVLTSLRLQATLIDSSGTQGIALRRGAGFTADSIGLIIRGSGAQPEVDARFPTGHPIDIDAPAVHTIPAEGDNTGNRRDEIIVRTPTRVSIDEGFPYAGVPYFIDELFSMYEPGGADLTMSIAAGNTLRFDTSGGGAVGMILGNVASRSEVRLLATGTATQPIAFTSASSTPAAGDWAGIMMANAPSVGNVVSHVVIEYAGGETGTRGYGCGTMENVGGLLAIEWKPAAPFITGSTFRETRGAGIVSGWALGAGEPETDLRANNVFEGIVDYMDEGHCDVAEWHSAIPDCRVPRTNGVTCVAL